jgi:hypothetical protein
VGLRSWAKAKVVQKAGQRAARELGAWAAEEQARLAVTNGEASTMSVWLKALGVAFASGVSVAVADFISNGVEFSKAGLLHIAAAALAGGLVAAAAYLKQSPLTGK